LTARASLEADFDIRDVVDGGRQARVAIASYEFNGVVRNGGIGTACTSLARALAADGHEVDLFFSGWAEDPSDAGFERWRRHYEELGIALHWVDYDKVAHWDTALYNTRHSLVLYQLLRDHDRERPYDVIHLVESLGHGFYPAMAKRAGVAFQQATVVVGVHSPRRWLAEAHGLPFDHPVELGDEHMERRTIELADVVVSPSRHMLDWLESRGVRLPARSYVQQYVTTFDLAEPVEESAEDAARPVDEIVFFGRLESRKGLKVFCDAIDELAATGADELAKVTFLGKQMPIGNAMSGEYLRERASRWPWEATVIDGLDRDAALDYLRSPGRLAVMASLMDNSPNTVYEAIGLGISFLASRAGGTGELVHPDDFEQVTYDPCDPLEREIAPGDPGSTRPRQTGTVLARRIREALGSPKHRARYAVDPAANRATHMMWHRALATRTIDREAEPPPAAPESTPVGDLAKAPARHGLVLLTYPDAERSPDLGPALMASAESSSDGALFTALGSYDVNTSEGPIERVLLPTGGPPPSGLLGNCFGAGVALVRLDALDRLGLSGETSMLPATVADLVARAALAGERIDVVPEVLYHLPATAVPGGALSTLESPLEMLRPYHAEMPSPTRDIASVAARLLREEAAIRDEAARATAAAADASARLAMLQGSRSFRMTAPLRRAVARVKRVRR
jgi:glycosyltransferase involved in cell wall biosynthesis